MKLNENYILRTVAGSDVVVAVGKEAAKLRGMMNLNDTAAFIWRCLEKGFDEEKIIEKLKEEYTGADDKTLRLEVQTFLDKLINMGIVQK
ncbi:MAG TPA: PqqD family protein [Oscillospiraceae bacterium]|nr:PqqD family protein [Oscillospiraceae bacterium]